MSNGDSSMISSSAAIGDSSMISSSAANGDRITISSSAAVGEISSSAAIGDSSMISSSVAIGEISSSAAIGDSMINSSAANGNSNMISSSAANGNSNMTSSSIAIVEISSSAAIGESSMISSSVAIGVISSSAAIGDGITNSSAANGNSNMISSSAAIDSSDDDISEEWAIILVVYGLVSFQLLLAVTVGAIVVSHSGIPHFVLHTRPGLAIYIISIVLWFIIQCFLMQFRRHCPCNCVAFLLWSLSFAFAVGFSCSYSNGSGKTVLAVVIWMSIVALSLTLYSIWGMIKNIDFSLWRPLIFFILLLICIYVPIQVYHPFAKLSTTIYGFLVALSFCGHTFFTGNTIVKHVSKSRDHSFFGPIFAATVFVYWHFLVHKPGRRELLSARN